MKLRILLADDHDIVRRGLRTVVEEKPGWEVCAEARNGREAVEMAEELRPDLAILDISMPEMDGLGAARQIRERSPQTQILILTQLESESLIRQVLEAGARGYLLKSDAGEELEDAITAVRAGRTYFTRKISDALLENYLKAPAAARPEAGSLTAREREIVQLIAEGKSSKEVASLLDMSVKTVETHRANIMRKLELGSLSELVLYAVRNKIVEP